MEKNGAVAIVASKAADEEAPVPVLALVEALKAAAILVHTLVPAFAVAAGEEAPVPASTVAAGEEAPVPVPAPAVLLQIPHGWDPYGENDYIRLKNPFDTSLADTWSEGDGSNVCSDDESMDTKTCQVLRRLKFVQFNGFFAGDVYRCPFCTRSLATDFNSLVMHAEDVKTSGPSKNVNAFRAQHKALGFHFRNLQKVAIEEGRMPPIKPKAPKVKGLGSRKWRKRHRDEAKALLAQAMMGY